MSSNSLEDRTKIQRELDKLENWAIDNKMKFNNEKCKVLQRIKNKCTNTEVGNWLGSSTAEKDLGVVVDHNLNMS